MKENNKNKVNKENNDNKSNNDNNKNKQKVISIVVYTILFTIIIALSSFLIWGWYINDMYYEYEAPYNDEMCYTVEYDDRSITVTRYGSYGNVLYYSEKENFENGKRINQETKKVYKTKSAAKNAYKNMLEKSSWFISDIKLEKNVVTYTNNGKITYLTEEIKEKIESFTTNEEIIKYCLEIGETNNFGIAEEYKRIK